MYCKNCGSYNNDKINYCKNCGIKMDNTEQSFHPKQHENVNPLPSTGNHNTKALSQEQSISKPGAKMKSEILHWIGGLVGFAATYFIGYTIGNYASGIAFQWLFVVIVYSVLLRIIPKLVKPSMDKDTKYTKYISILGLVGLTGLISPIVGFIFALPAYVLSTEALTKNAPHRVRTQLITGIITLLCILNANAGVLIHQQY